MPAKSEPLFVYGTLLDDELRSVVIGRHRPLMMATGHDVRAQLLAATELPTLVPAPGMDISGALVWGLTEEEWKRVAAYEGADHEIRDVQVSPTDGGPAITAKSFFSRLGVELLPYSWDLESWSPRARDSLLRETQAMFASSL
jgi:hypothetical protein